MLLTEMKLGKSLEIFVFRGEYKFRLVSKIEDVVKGRVSVTLIASKNRVFQFYDTDKIFFVYRDENRLWKWNNVMPGMTEIDGYKLHCFYTDKEGESFNRRNSYRVFIGEDIKLFYPKEDEDNNIGDDSETEMLVCDGFLKDLSENGAGIFSDERFSLKDILSFTVYTDLGALQCKAEVVRISQENHGIYRRYYGCCFVKSDQNLTKFLFSKQRQLLHSKRNKER